MCNFDYLNIVTAMAKRHLLEANSCNKLSEQKGYDVIYNPKKQPLQARHHLTKVPQYRYCGDQAQEKGERSDERRKQDEGKKIKI